VPLDIWRSEVEFKKPFAPATVGLARRSKLGSDNTKYRSTPTRPIVFLQESDASPAPLSPGYAYSFLNSL